MYDDIAVQREREVVIPDRLERPLRQPDRGALDLVSEALQRLGDVVRRDRAEQPAVDAGLARDLDREAVDLRAALLRRGEGVGLGRLSLCLDDIVTGRLVQPFGPIVPVAMTYRLLTSPEKAAWPKVQRFREWILAEIAGLPPLPPAPSFGGDGAGHARRKGAGTGGAAA